LLIELEREVEPGGRAGSPPARHVSTGLPVKRAIHLDCIEMLRIERELVESVGALALRSRLRVEETVPRPFARRVMPARRSNAAFTHEGILQSGLGIRDSGFG